MGLLEEALACQDRALAIDPKDVKVLLARGQILYERMERPDEGLAAFRQAIAIDPKKWGELPERAKKRVDRPRYWSVPSANDRRRAEPARPVARNDCTSRRDGIDAQVCPYRPTPPARIGTGIPPRR